MLAKENIKGSIHDFQLCFSMEESKKKNQSWLLGKIFDSQARKEGVVCSIYSGAIDILTNLGWPNMASGHWKSIIQNEKEILPFFAASTSELLFEPGCICFQGLLPFALIKLEIEYEMSK